MNTIELDAPKRLELQGREEKEVLQIREENIIRLGEGLLGFKEHREFLLLAHPSESPFMWLQSLGDASLAFIVVCPYHIKPDYQPEVNDADAKALEIRRAEDAMVLNIVTLREDGMAMANLRGPIVLNRNTLSGKQVILDNARDYDHPFPVTYNGN